VTRLAAALARAGRAVRWYLGELTGEADYDHYLLRHRQLTGSPAGALSRREFERRRWDDRAATAGNRCC
jgi:uncharacterized short protein YbdD (DUF466 family)